MPNAAGNRLSPVAVNRHTQADSAQQLFAQRQSRSQTQRQIEKAAAHYSEYTGRVPVTVRSSSTSPVALERMATRAMNGLFGVRVSAQW